MADSSTHKAESRFVRLDVEPCAASEDGLTLRWKRTREAREARVLSVPYESEGGASGRWRVASLDRDDAEREARAFEVEDSSDGAVWVIPGGAHGLVLRLVHEATGELMCAPVLEPYLLLALSVRLE